MMSSRSLFALPAPSLRFVPIYLRNLLVWRKLALASVLGNIADPLITLVAFGYGPVSYTHLTLPTNREV